MVVVVHWVEYARINSTMKKQSLSVVQTISSIFNLLFFLCLAYRKEIAWRVNNKTIDFGLTISAKIEKMKKDGIKQL